MNLGVERLGERISGAMVPMEVEARLAALGLALPAPIVVPAGFSIPFSWARQYEERVYLSGHGALHMNGSPAGPFGKVGAEVTLKEAQASARAATLAMLSSLKQVLGDLDRVAAWLVISGMVNVAPGFAETTQVINSCSSLITELFGNEVGRHARTAIGMAQLPLNLPVVISAEVAVRI